VSVIDGDASDVEADQKTHGPDTQALHEGASHPVSATAKPRAGTEIKSQQQDAVGAETHSKLAQAVAGRPSSVGRPSPAHSSGSVAAFGDRPVGEELPRTVDPVGIAQTGDLPVQDIASSQVGKVDAEALPSVARSAGAEHVPFARDGDAVV